MSICNDTLPKICIKNLKKQFGSIQVLEDISMTVLNKDVVSFFGASGSGKSTIFNILSGVISEDSGQIIIDGMIGNTRIGKVGYMHQKDMLLPWKKIIDNVSLPLRIKGISKSDARETVWPYFGLFGLNGFEYKLPSQLSIGMRQRASLLRTYMCSKNILLLDEPFSSLDFITKERLYRWLQTVIEELGPTVLMVTHDIDEALLLSNKVFILSNRPATIIEEIKVDLPMPRGRETGYLPQFIKMKKDILNLLSMVQ